MAGAVGGLTDLIYRGEGRLVKVHLVVALGLEDGGVGGDGRGVLDGVDAVLGQLVDAAQYTGDDGADQKQNERELENLIHFAASFAAFFAAFSAAMSSLETPN